MIGSVSGRTGMRLLFGMIIGALLTIGGAYVADSRADPLQGGRMVNWDVVGEKVGELTADLRTVWEDFTRRITGPP
jgi:hypothetical protein